MAKVNTEIAAFNRGIVSRLALARTDIKRVALSAETMTNWMPRVLGSMSLRPGLQHIGSTRNDLAARIVPFVFAFDQTALIELTDSTTRFHVNDTVLTRPSVASAVTNGDFSTAVPTTTCTFTASSTTCTYVGADIFAVDDPIRFTTTGTLPSNITAGVTYFVKTVNTGTNVITVATTVGGTAITFSGAGTPTITVTNLSGVTGWTDADDTGCDSGWETGDVLYLRGNGTGFAERRQTVTVGGGDVGVEHALRLVVTRGEVILRVGSTSGGDEYISETTLHPGEHSRAFTPTGNFYIQLLARKRYRSMISSCQVESAGAVTIPTPWGASVLSDIRTEQSADVVFVACKDILQKRIERRSSDSRSWSVVDYVANAGPFRVENLTDTTITPGALYGDTTLTASKPTFKSTNVGSLIRVNSIGQTVTAPLTAYDTATDEILVTGIGGGRSFGITITGTWTATIALQRSIGEPGDWVTVASYTTNQSTSYTDSLDNQVIYYRLWCSAYTSGTPTCTLAYAAGSIQGIGRVTEYVSPTVVNIITVKNFGALKASKRWAEGAWSPRRGYPSATVLHDGRLWWAGGDKIWGSISDDYAGFDENFEGDAGPLSRSIGSGPVDTINWLLSSQRMLVGAQGAELIARSSSLDEPLTPTNFNLKEATTYGSHGVPAVKVDQSGIFVNRSGSRIFELAYDQASYSYAAIDLTAICPEVGSPSVVALAVQRQIDTRLHAVLSNGKVAVLVFDKQENVRCWVMVETDGAVEGAFVLPGTEEDQVYYVVARTIGGATKRYIEKWALVSETVGGAINKQADSFIVYTGAAATHITGLSHLEGKTVVCWANGVDKGTFTVSGGEIVLPTAQTNVVVGLGYTATYISSKLAHGAQGGSSLTQVKRLDHLGLLLADTHYQGLRYGVEAGYLDDLPLVEDGVATGAGTIWDAYDHDAVEVNGTYSTDTRLYLEAAAPRPCTVLGAVIGMQTHDKI